MISNVASKKTGELVSLFSIWGQSSSGGVTIYLFPSAALVTIALVFLGLGDGT